MTEKRKRGRPRKPDAKLCMSTRLEPAVVARLDGMRTRAGTFFRRTRSALLEFAVQEFVDRHAPEDRRADAGSL
jgi:predicted transcriptional regulator